MDHRSSQLRQAFGWPLFVLALVAGLLALEARAQAAFPGKNGKIAFDTNRDGNQEIYTMNADGSNPTRLTNNTAIDQTPAWSPDGTKIAFVSNRDGNDEIYTMNADGTGIVTRLTNNPAPDGQPAWSPDGNKIAFMSDRDTPLTNEIYTMNANGTGVPSRLTNNTADDGDPDWSADGTKIAFHTNRDGNYEIYTMNADGTSPLRHTTHSAIDQSPDWLWTGTAIAFQSTRFDGITYDIWSVSVPSNSPFQETSDPASTDAHPAWSPDGQKLAFHSNRGGGTLGIYTTSAGGGGGLTNIATNGSNPDWQPRNPSYQGPVGASPLRVSLVPAFSPCLLGAAQVTHGGPLSSPSCANPTLASSTVTIGPNSIGFARMVVCPTNATSTFCNPAGNQMPLPDIRFTGSIRDVICQRTGTPPNCSAGQDYNPNTATGPYTDGGGGTAGASPACFPSGSSSTACAAGADLTEKISLQITDTRNGPGQLFSGTTQTITYAIPIDCLPAASTSAGSACGVSTTANALTPGAIVANATAIWDLEEVKVYDSGPDGIRNNADDQLFESEGLFAP
jgi:Tol biopolymer transport system component